MNLLSFMLDGETTGSKGGGWGTIIMLVVVVAAFYFLMIRPQKKQEKQANELRNSLAVGDEVTTIGGIVGKIVSLREETVVLETTKDKTHIRFLRAAIRSVDVRAEDSKAPVKEEAPAEKPGKKKKKTPVAPAADKTEEATATEETSAIEDVVTTEVAVATDAEAPASEDSSDKKD